MVGVVLVTHPHLGEEFIRSAEMICGKMPRVLTVSIDTRKEVEELRLGIAEAIKKVDDGDGVLILTDMFGGTPSNMSLAFLVARERSYDYPYNNSTDGCRKTYQQGYFCTIDNPGKNISPHIITSKEKLSTRWGHWRRNNFERFAGIEQGSKNGHEND